jgi:DtxR family Mn-dependent transcriptional regulator
MDEDRVEEMLELIWTEREADQVRRSTLVAKSDDPDPEGVLHEMERRGLLDLSGENVLLLRPGEDLASEVIRRHRLAEVLLNQVLEVDEQETESTACKFEHMLGRDVADRVCTFLGHPPVCPHGKKIPRGRCCDMYSPMVRPLVFPLSDLGLGAKGRIVFINPRSHARLDRLSALGVFPGCIVRLHQRRPSFVLEIGETTLALDPEISREIYVLELGAESDGRGEGR